MFKKEYSNHSINGSSKGQSAMEYLMTYGWSILLVAIALIALFELGVFNSNNFSSIGSCTPQANYLCSNPLLNTSGYLTIKFGEIYQTTSLITGVSCTDNSTVSPVTFNSTYLEIRPGEKTYLQFICPLSSNTIGSSFVGSLWIKYNADSVNNQISKIGVVKVSVSTENQLGTIAVQQSTLYSVPISFSNFQSSATQAPFQQMLIFDSARYSQYINSNWNNVEFTTGNVASGSVGTVLQAWVESGASNTATDTTVWIKLPNGIPAESTMTIYANFLTTNIMSSTGPTGEAPELSTPYAKYDNGKNVFNFYENFAGDTLNTKLWQFNNQGIVENTYAVNNGLHLYPAGTSYTGFIGINTSQGVFLNSEIADFYAQWGKPISGGYATINFGSGYGINVHTQLEGGNGNTYLALCPYNSKPYSYLNYQDMYSSNGNCPTTNYPYAYSLSQQPAEIYSIASNGVDSATGIAIQQGTQTANTVIYWIRDRAAPPNSAMPGQISVSASSSSSEIYQGMDSSFTSDVQDSAPPYSYQWYSEAPGQSTFIAISGATSSSYTFSTTGSSTIGTYLFKVNVTDSLGEQAPSNNISILVLPSETVSYVPVILSNQQSSAIQSNFQQMIYFDPSTYSGYLTQNLSNIEFTSGSPGGSYEGKPLYSWIESGASSSSSNTVIWINLGSNTIGAAGSNSNTLTIYMNFLPDNSPVDLSLTGYAPQLYCSNGCFQNTYGANDNGYKVFPFYDGFETLNLSKWSENAGNQPGALTVDNGLNMNPSLNPQFLYPTLTSYASVWVPGTTIDIYGRYGKIIENAYAILGLGTMFNGYYGLLGINTAYMSLYSSSGSTETNYPTGSGSSIPTNGIYSVMRTTGNIISMLNYANSYTISDSKTGSYQYGFFAGYEVEPSTFYWVRNRVSPPDGVMPQFSFGGVN